MTNSWCTNREQIPLKVVTSYETVIEAYETGKMSENGTVYFKNGEMVSKKEAKIHDALGWWEICVFRIYLETNKECIRVIDCREISAYETFEDKSSSLLFVSRDIIKHSSNQISCFFPLKRIDIFLLAVHMQLLMQVRLRLRLNKADKI